MTRFFDMLAIVVGTLITFASVALALYVIAVTFFVVSAF